MRRDLLIVGQGLAGTLLGWELERAGIPFAVVDAGPAARASQVAAGIVNPVTGLRFVKSWRVEALLPAARACYREIESAWSVAIWQDRRIRRLFADDRQRKQFAEKRATGELAPYVSAPDEHGFWIEPAGRLDVTVLLSAARERWTRAGILTEQRVDWVEALQRHELVIDCAGRGTERFGFIPWEYSKGEILTLEVEGLETGVILNRGHWVVPEGPGRARIGATNEPGRTDLTPSAVARRQLEASAKTMLERPYSVVGHDAGVRVNLPDRRPVAGRHPDISNLGIINALGAKGALLAPWLGRQWVNHLTEGVPFDRETDTARFWQRNLSQA